MYNNEKVTYGTQSVEAPKETMLPTLNYRLEDLLDRQEKCIYGISDKIHNILNKRVEKATGKDGTDIPPSSDFHGEMQVKCRRLENHNAQLENILQHLSEIV